MQGNAMNTFFLIGVTMLMLATTAGGARGDEKTAIAALEKMGASITRDESRPGKPAIKVVISGEVTDAGLKQLGALTQIKSLTIHTCRDVNAALQCLSSLKELESLDLQMCPLEGARLQGLAEL